MLRLPWRHGTDTIETKKGLQPKSKRSTKTVSKTNRVGKAVKSKRGPGRPRKIKETDG